MSQAKLRALPSIGHLVDDPGQPGQLEALKDKDDEAVATGPSQLCRCGAPMQIEQRIV